MCLRCGVVDRPYHGWTSGPPYADGWRPVTRVEGLAAGFDAAEQLADFRLAVATVPAEGADARELACFGPAGHGLGVDTEQRGDLRRGEQRLGSRRRLDGTTGGHGCHPSPRTLPPVETGFSRRS